MPNIESTLEFLGGDLAGKYRQTHSQAAQTIPKSVTDADLASIEANGYVMIENLLSEEELDSIRAAAEPLLSASGRNDFEGLKTQRVYGVLSKTRAIDRLVDHPRILAILDRLFMPNYLLSQLG